MDWTLPLLVGGLILAVAFYSLQSWWAPRVLAGVNRIASPPPPPPPTNLTLAGILRPPPAGSDVGPLKILAVRSSGPIGVVTERRIRGLVEGECVASWPEGAFQIGGLPPGEYVLVADSQDWILNENGPHEAGKTNARPHLVPAIRLKVELLDEPLEIPVDEAECAWFIDSKGSGSREIRSGAKEGLLQVRWGSQGEEIDGFRIRFEAASPGYRTVKEEWDVPAGQRFVERTVRMRKAETK